MVLAQNIFVLEHYCDDYHDSLHSYHGRIVHEDQTVSEMLRHCKDFVVHWRNNDLVGSVVVDDYSGGTWASRQIALDIADDEMASPRDLGCRANQIEGNRGEMNLVSIAGSCCTSAAYSNLAV